MGISAMAARSQIARRQATPSENTTRATSPPARHSSNTNAPPPTSSTANAQHHRRAPAPYAKIAWAASPQSRKEPGSEKIVQASIETQKAHGLCTTTKGAQARKYTQLNKGCALHTAHTGEQTRESESVGGCQYTAIRK